MFGDWQNSKLKEKANAVPVYEKSDEKILRNYCPVSHLPACGKILRN